MYELAYHLNTDPFRLSPDHRFCFRHKSFIKARSYLQFALQREEGFIMISGAPGTGKTTLLDDLLSELDRHPVVIARLVTTQLGPKELLNMVAYEFGLDVTHQDKSAVLNRLQHFFERQHLKGSRALLIIDEAQNLEPAALEEMRMLSNLQVAGQPLLQIFLVGQENLHDIVLDRNMTQFHQRLIASAHLEPMDADETATYVLHRLETAGWHQDPQISLGALRRIHIFSQGVPRRVNHLCSRLLLFGAVEDRHRLDSKDVQAVIAELREEMLSPENDFDPIAGSLDSDDKINAQPVHHNVTHITDHLGTDAATARTEGNSTARRPKQQNDTRQDKITPHHIVASRKDHLVDDDLSARETSTQGKLLAFFGFLVVLGMIAGITVDLRDDHWQHMLTRQSALAVTPGNAVISSSVIPGLTIPNTDFGATFIEEETMISGGIQEKTSPEGVIQGNLPRIREILRDKLSDGIINITDNEQAGIKLQLSGRTHFELDSARLKPTLQAVLARMALLIRDQPDINIHITGHSDASGPRLRNKKLSAYRSRLAAAYLARLGISQQRISHEGQSTNATLSATEPQLNRRIEIHLNPVQTAK